MKRKRVVLTAVVLLICVCAALVTLDPAARVHGWAGGEPFYQGKSATAWRRELRKPDEVAPAAALKALADGKAAEMCGWLLERAPETTVRRRAADALSQMGKDAVPAGGALVKALSDADPLVSKVAMRGVAGLAPDVPAGAVPGLVKHFPDVEAIRAVAAFKAGGLEAQPELMKLFGHDDLAVRLQAMRAVGKIGEPAKSAIPVLIAALEKDETARVRERAAEVLGEFGPASVEAIPALTKALKDEDHKVRRDAVRSLGQIGPPAKSALTDVKKLIDDPEDIVRESATKAARLIDPSGK